VIARGYAGIRKSRLKDVSIINPASSFPRRKDPMHTMWMARDAKAALHLFEETSEYLGDFKKKHLDKDKNIIVPDAAFAQAGDFGIVGHDPKSNLKRVYRELQANSMFTVEKHEPPPLIIKPGRHNKFKRPRSPTEAESRWEKKSKEYILMRRDEMTELASMEKLLKKEKKILQRQCSWLFNDTQMSARIPLPVTKMAVTDVCKAEMREAQSLLKIVLRVDESKDGWKSRRSHLLVDTVKGGTSPFDVAATTAEATRNGTYVSNSTVWPKYTVDMAKLEATPVKSRAIWFIRQKEMAERELREFEMSTMLLEETVQRLSWRYLEAKNRMEDYNQYYYYSTRYGPFEEEDFNNHPMPGATYHKRCTAGARSFQRMWWAKWPPRRMWLDICATRMGALWRGIWVRKHWRPIVRMRMHHGRYAIMLRCLNPWKAWVGKMKRAKKLLGKILVGAKRLHFTAFRDYVKNLKEERERIARAAMKRFIMRREFAVFNSWYSYVEKKKRIMTMMKRAIGNPAFKHWLDYVEMIKEQKMVLRGYTAIQSMYRGWKAREEFAGLLKFRHIMKRLVRTKKSMNFVGAALHALVEHEERKKMDEELKDAVGAEEKRLAEFTEQFDKVESGIRKMKAMQMKTRKGKKELKELTDIIIEEKMADHKQGKGPKITKNEAEEMARARILNHACDEARLQMKHDFEAKKPPRIQSCDFKNPQTFIYEEHYLNACPNFADIDLCLKNPKGAELLEFYIDRVHGVGPEKYSINFWQHVEKWKKTKSDTEEYRDEAVAVFNDHIDASATQPAEIDKNLRERLAVELMKIEIQEDKKDEVEETKSKGGISGFFARFTKVEETTLRANIFDQAIFEVVLYLRARTWAGFLGSNLGEEWEEYQRKEKAKARQRRVDKYLQERRAKALSEAKDVKVKLSNMKMVVEEHKRLMLEANEVLLEVFVEELVTNAVDDHVKEIEAAKLAKEKAKYAAINNMASLFMKSLEDNMCEEMINKVVDELVEVKISQMTERKALEVMNKFTEPFLDETVERWVKNTMGQWMKEGGHLSEKERREERLATIVQKRARGYLARINARRMVAERFTREFDEWSNDYYWMDNYTQTTSWEQPMTFLWKAVDKSVVKHIAPPSGPPGFAADEEFYDDGSYDDGSYDDGSYS